MTLAEIEKRAILEAMARLNNMAAVCHELQIGRTTLYRKLNDYRGAA